MEAIKHCPFCGHEECAVYTLPAGGEGGVPRHRVACYTCGALGDFFDEFIHGRGEAETIAKAIKCWNRRARIARNEELADLVGEIRQLLKVVFNGCKAKSQAAEKGREAIGQILGTSKADGKLDLILPQAKKFEIKEWDVNRAAR
jgi:Lar family restriction alleviation protein